MDNQQQISEWVIIRTGHDTQLKGIDGLRKSLRRQGIVVQYSEPWHPAFTTGLEFIIEYLANFDFQAAIVGGVAFDILKGAYQKFQSILSDFYKSNDHNDFIPNVTIKYDDITIKFHGIQSDNLNYHSKFIDKLADHIKNLNTLGVEKISKIEIPCEYNEDAEDAKFRVSDFQWVGDNPEIWQITYGANETAYYFPLQKCLAEV